ncbi:MAG TPA: hypothetical protein VGV89_01505 [Thermoplasmata archaeon]|nr:hypothetical protein [Thermoplasmata archaeon]
MNTQNAAIVFVALLSVAAIVIAGVAYLGQPPITGAAGSQGSQGLPGTNGTPGRNGNNGTQGPAGPRGTQGPAGHNGLNGLNGTNGVNGSRGLPGRNGTNGKQGATGQNGTSYTYADLSLTFQLCGKPYDLCRSVPNVTLYVWGPCTDLGRGIWTCNISLNLSYSPTMHNYDFDSVQCLTPNGSTWDGATSFYFASANPSLPYTFYPSGSQPFTLWFQVVQASGTITGTVDVDVEQVRAG